MSLGGENKAKQTHKKKVIVEIIVSPHLRPFRPSQLYVFLSSFGCSVNCNPAHEAPLLTPESSPSRRRLSRCL